MHGPEMVALLRILKKKTTAHLVCQSAACQKGEKRAVSWPRASEQAQRDISPTQNVMCQASLQLKTYQLSQGREGMTSLRESTRHLGPTAKFSRNSQCDRSSLFLEFVSGVSAQYNGVTQAILEVSEKDEHERVLRQDDTRETGEARLEQQRRAHSGSLL